ncbi:MAG TPA: M48 family metallopeptidase, partial [Phycisphaeraceae bacterium]
MQLLLLALVLGIFVHDAVLNPTAGAVALPAQAMLMRLLAPKLALLGGYWIACVLLRRRLGRPGGQRAMRWIDRLTALFPLLALGLYGLDLFGGGLIWIRQHVGDLILADELLLMLPTLLLLAGSWWAYYSIDRRLREAALIQRIDAGLPVYPIWSRGQFLLAQARHHLGLILVPVLLVYGWGEVVAHMEAARWPLMNQTPPVLWLVGGAGAIFLMAPLLVRHLWDTIPLPAGELRDRLLAMCRRHRIGVRELLLWRTFGGTINAAVMGLIAPLRYILLTDGLLEMLNRQQVEAVMAHELAHVRRHHLWWLLAAAVGSLGVLELVLGTLLATLQQAAPPPPSGPLLVRADTPMIGHALDLLRSPGGTIALAIALAGLTWATLLGWVMRRVERQADTFAVQHLVSERPNPMRNAEGQVVVDPLSAYIMIDTLQQVAQLNQIPVRRRSWRHG